MNCATWRPENVVFFVFSILISSTQEHISSSVDTFITCSGKYLKARRVNNRSKDNLHMNDVCEWECVTEEGCRSRARTERSAPLCPHSKDQVRPSGTKEQLSSAWLWKVLIVLMLYTSLYNIESCLHPPWRPCVSGLLLHGRTSLICRLRSPHMLRKIV